MSTMSVAELRKLLDRFEPETEVWIQVRRGSKWSAMPAQRLVLIPDAASDGNVVLAVESSRP